MSVTAVVAFALPAAGRAKAKMEQVIAAEEYR
jgi:hypothetical protein